MNFETVGLAGPGGVLDFSGLSGEGGHFEHFRNLTAREPQTIPKGMPYLCYIKINGFRSFHVCLRYRQSDGGLTKRVIALDIILNPIY